MLQLSKVRSFCQKLPRAFKKLVTVSTTFILVIDNSDKEIMLEKMSCIYYLVKFQKEQVKALFDSGSKVNAIYPNFTQKLGFHIRKTNIRA